jgi:hypothetical protein
MEKGSGHEEEESGHGGRCETRTSGTETALAPMAGVVWRALCKTPCVTEDWRRYGVETCACRGGDGTAALGPRQGRE